MAGELDIVQTWPQEGRLPKPFKQDAVKANRSDILSDNISSKPLYSTSLHHTPPILSPNMAGLLRFYETWHLGDVPILEPFGNWNRRSWVNTGQITVTMPSCSAAFSETYLWNTFQSRGLQWRKKTWSPIDRTLCTEKKPNTQKVHSCRSSSNRSDSKSGAGLGYPVGIKFPFLRRVQLRMRGWRWRFSPTLPECPGLRDSSLSFRARPVLGGTAMVRYWKSIQKKHLRLEGKDGQSII